jgi:hypothetical protein
MQVGVIGIFPEQLLECGFSFGGSTLGKILTRLFPASIVSERGGEFGGEGETKRCSECQGGGQQRQPLMRHLFPHFVGDFVFSAFFDELIVLQSFLHAQPGEENHQDQHPNDRNIVRLGDDREKILQSAHFFHKKLNTRFLRILRKNIRNSSGSQCELRLGRG